LRLYAYLNRQARRILREEGIVSLVKRGSIYLAKKLFKYSTFYLIEESLSITEIDPDKVKPDIPELTHNYILSNQPADLIASEFEDFGPYQVHAHIMLDYGAIACCIYAEKEVASIGWIELNKTNRYSFNDAPYKVHGNSKEAYFSKVMTLPKWR